MKNEIVKALLNAIVNGIEEDIYGDDSDIIGAFREVTNYEEDCDGVGAYVHNENSVMVEIGEKHFIITVNSTT